MRGNELLDKMELIDSVYIEEAENYTKKKKPVWNKWSVLAACLCLAVLGTLIWQRISSDPNRQFPVAENDESSRADSQSSQLTDPEGGVTIPPHSVSLAPNDAASMVSFFIYQGKCYSWYDWTDDTSIMGECLGTATGLIDEWTSKDGYVEFAGSVKGDFYAVKGFDPSFMLCMQREPDNIAIFICNNGITLSHGSDLYEDRIHLTDGLYAVQYEDQFSWFHSQDKRYQLNNIDDAILDFIGALNAASFIHTDSVPFEEGLNSLYDTQLYHLYFQMDNGIPIHLRLLENGYVLFEGILEVCVQVPEKTYQALLDLLDSHTDAIELEPVGALGSPLADCLNDPDFGKYIPAYVPEGFSFAHADIIYFFDPETGEDTDRVQQIWIEYANPENENENYQIRLMWTDGCWVSPIIDSEDLSIESITELIEEEPGIDELWLSFGVQHDDVVVAISAYNVDAESVYKILSSVQ